VRCDLHVHSSRSGPVELRLLAPYANESYAEPRQVYEQARRRGMDLVTLTDHDTIAGALELRGLPGTFLSEEVTCRLPGGRSLHLGVYDISEAQHQAIARRRDDAEALFAYLAEESIPACLNHPFSALTGRRETADLCRALASLPLVETRNGMMSAAVNARAEAARRRARLPGVGGSDAHTLASVARAHTVVPGASSREEFLDGLRRGLTVPAGESGSYARLTADVARIAGGALRDAALQARQGGGWTRLAVLAAVAPALPLLPLITAGVFLQEQLFARRHDRRLRQATEPRRRSAPSGPFGPAPAPGLAR
jgi:predicted metal-dependent phosphoesterase TrpH